MAKTLGAVINVGLMSLGEPEITAITTSNILQRQLLEEANNAVRDILARPSSAFDWGLKHTTLLTTAKVTTGTVTVTKGSTTVTALNATQFADVTTSMWFRLTANYTSYAIASVDIVSNPNTLTLANAFLDTSTSGAGYRCFQDTFSISVTDFNDMEIIAYGNASAARFGVIAPNRDSQISLVRLSDIFYASGGDLHLDTSGRPRMLSRISADTSDYPRYVLWPYPDTAYLLDLWYSISYSQNSTFATNLFGGDAPQLAYDAVEARVRYRAYLYDRNVNMAAAEMQLYNICIANLLRRENSLDSDQSMKVGTYRQSYDIAFPSRSGIAFDTKSSFSR